jgi:hypothetical protein
MALALRTRAVDFDEVIDSFDFVTELTARPLHNINTKIMFILYSFFSIIPVERRINGFHGQYRL